MAHDPGVMMVYSTSSAKMRSWLASGALLPNELRFVAVGYPDETQSAVSGQRVFAEYIQTHPHFGRFCGESIDLEYDFCTSQFVRIVLSDTHTSDRSAVLAYASSLIEHFSELETVFAFACIEDEFHFRNLLQVDLWGDGRMSGGLLGLDIARLIPGLYWLTYFDSAFAAERRFDVPALCDALQAGRFKFANGTALKLYSDPEDWIHSRERVTGVLDQQPGFFAMSRVGRPDTSSAAAFAYYLETVSKEWP